MLFSLSPFTKLLPGLENCWANFKTFSRIQDSVRNLKMNLHFFKLWCICFFSMRMSNVGKFPWSWFLGDGTQREKNCCCLFISSITHEIRHFHVAVMQWLIKTVYLAKPIAFLMFSMWWSSSLLKLPNYWKISIPFLSQGISQACLLGRFVLQR